MQTSVIRQRVADFLQHHAPFDSLPEADVLALAGSGKVKFHESEEYICRAGSAKIQVVWIIQQGRVELLDEAPSAERLRDLLGEGDMIGLDRFTGDGIFRHSARTASDVILYGIDAALLESLTAVHPALRRFLAAHFSISGHDGFQRTSWLNAAPPPLDFLRARLVTIPAGAPPADIAARLATARNGIAAFVDELGHPIGVVTARDLIDPPASAAPVPAIAAPIATRSATRALLEAETEYLAITANGTPGSPLDAILTAADLALFCGFDPARLLREIRLAASPEELTPLLPQIARFVDAALAQPQDIDGCARFGARVVAAVAEACIRVAAQRLAAAGISEPVVPWCWVLFGTSARGDLLGPEFPAIAAVYDDSHPLFQASDSIYFAALAGDTAARFHSLGLTGPGLDWPDGARPGMPLSEWKRFYSETIRDIYTHRAFFDLRPIFGDFTVADALLTHIDCELTAHPAAIPPLALETLSNIPPLTFFQGLVLGVDGERSDSFDIDASVISPIASAARVFALSARRLRPAGTLARLEAASRDFPDGAAVLAEAADAFRVGLYYQARATDGGNIHPSTLAKFDQLLFKAAFASIQRLLEFTVATFAPAASAALP